MNRPVYKIVIKIFQVLQRKQTDGLIFIYTSWIGKIVSYCFNLHFITSEVGRRFISLLIELHFFLF